MDNPNSPKDNENPPADQRPSGGKTGSEDVRGASSRGGADFETTDLDRPADLSRPGGDLVGSENREFGPTSLNPSVAEMDAPTDPTGDDPFIPGAGEASDDLDSADLLSDREKEWRDEVRESDPEGLEGPTYEAQQGMSDAHGGSTDPHNDLTHDSSGNSQERHDAENP